MSNKFYTADELTKWASDNGMSAYKNRKGVWATSLQAARRMAESSYLAGKAAGEERVRELESLVARLQVRVKFWIDDELKECRKYGIDCGEEVEVAMDLVNQAAAALSRSGGRG